MGPVIPIQRRSFRSGGNFTVEQLAEEETVWTLGDRSGF